MSTRSNIAKVIAPGQYKMIYCHWDGYPSHNGKILLEHYQDDAKIDFLLALGDISMLAPEIGEKHDVRMEGWITAYGRDRGETGVEARLVETDDPLKLCEQEYLYLWRDGKWFYSDHGDQMQEMTAKETEND